MTAIVVGNAGEILDALNYATIHNRELLIVAGLYNIDTPLVYTAPGPGSSVVIRGEGKGGRGPTGTVLRWTGAPGGVLLTLKGANNARVSGIAFDAWTNNGLGALFLKEANSTCGPGSSGVRISDCHFTGGAGPASYAIRIGDNTYQVSEVAITDCSIYGGGGTTRYGVVTATANTKNFCIRDCSIANCDYGVTHGEPPSGGGSGVLKLDTVAFANNRFTDVWAQTADSTTLDNCQSEQSARLFDSAGASNNPHAVAIRGTYFSSDLVPPDNIVIRVNGQLTIDGCSLENNRDGGSESRIVFGAASLSTGTNRCSISSRGNTYYHAVRFAPIYDSSGESIFAGRNGNYVGRQVRVSSIGDVGGVSGALVALQRVEGESQSMHRLAMEEVSIGLAGATYGTRGEPRRAVHKVTVSYHAFTAALSWQTRVLWNAPAETRICAAYTNTTEGFVLAGAAVTASLGSTTAATEFILSHSVTAPVSKGGDAADLGASLTNPRGFINMAIQTSINLRLASSVGNLGDGSATLLTAGAIDVYVVTEAIG